MPALISEMGISRRSGSSWIPRRARFWNTNHPRRCAPQSVKYILIESPAIQGRMGTGTKRRGAVAATLIALPTASPKISPR
jgi:hypothetical protein